MVKEDYSFLDTIKHPNAILMDRKAWNKVECERKIHLCYGSNYHELCRPRYAKELVLPPLVMPTAIYAEKWIWSNSYITKLTINEAKELIKQGAISHIRESDLR